MVAPHAPKGGWKKWFGSHPYQRVKYPVTRAPEGIVFFDLADSTPRQTKYEYVETWYEPSASKVFARLGNGPLQWTPMEPNMPEYVWDYGTDELFNLVVGEEPEPPPEPVGSGWDDFDWSK